LIKPLFINPIHQGEKVSFVPHGLLSILSYLNDRDIPFELLDLDLLCDDVDQIQDAICQVFEKKDILFTGISALITNYHVIRKIVRIIREIDEDQIIMVGGSLGATLPASLHCDLGADFLIDRDGEYVLEQIFNLFISKSINKLNIQRIIKSAPLYFDVSNYNNIPLYNIFDIEVYYKYIRNSGKRFSVISGRGCPMGCNFCFKMAGSKVRKKKVSAFVNELSYLKKTFGIDRFSFDDDNFAINPKWISEFLGELEKNKLVIEWRFQTSLQLLNDIEIIKGMKKCGMVGVSIGIESGSKHMLEKLNKKIPLDNANNIFAQLRNLDLAISCSFIIGYPGENEDYLDETLKFINQTCEKNTFQVFYYTPYPGTVGYEECKQKRIISDEKSYILNLRNQNAFSINCTDLKIETLKHSKKMMLSSGI
jgi:anaerobic magnesium-protoporphyrin IX monomethyl ester cyclase